MTPAEHDERFATCCRVCGTDAGLAFEEPPPTSSYDVNPARVFGLEAWLGRGGGKRVGSGPRTLCPTCADNAASWYLREYREWCRVADGLIASGPDDAELNSVPRPTLTAVELSDVRPARFLKQAITMLLAIAPAGFAANEHSALAAYAGDPRLTGLPGRYQIYLSLYHGPFTRFVGYSARLDVLTERSEELVELAYRPFSIVLSLAGEAELESTNITAFAELWIDDVYTIDLDLLNGFGHTPYPGDYRTLAAVERDRAKAARRRAA